MSPACASRCFTVPGRSSVGDVAVVCAASAPHRGEAYQACRALIDRVKARVPIWKREHGPEGAYWVGWEDARCDDGGTEHDPGSHAMKAAPRAPARRPRSRPPAPPACAPTPAARAVARARPHARARSHRQRSRGVPGPRHLRRRGRGVLLPASEGAIPYATGIAYPVWLALVEGFPAEMGGDVARFADRFGLLVDGAPGPLPVGLHADDGSQHARPLRRDELPALSRRAPAPPRRRPRRLGAGEHARARARLRRGPRARRARSRVHDGERAGARDEGGARARPGLAGGRRALPIVRATVAALRERAEARGAGGRSPRSGAARSGRDHRELRDGAGRARHARSATARRSAGRRSPTSAASPGATR